MSRVAILVLGMHRSGTSALTRLVGYLGAALPADGIDAHADNAKGYWESAGLVKADDQLLRVARSSWFDPRALDLSRLSSSALRSRRDRMWEAVERAYGSAPLMVLKDPRQCRFVPFVAEMLAEHDVATRAVLMLRAPAEIAGSVASRDGTTPAYAHLLWLRHMIEAERATRDMPRAIVSYDGMLADWRGTMARIAPLAGREGWLPEGDQAAEIDRFLDPALRHHAGAAAALEPPLADIVAAVDRGLDRLAEQDDAAARAALDEAYALLDGVPWLEGDIVHDELRHRRMPALPEDTATPPPPEPMTKPAPAPPPPEPKPETAEAIRLIRESGLFDEDWYRATYPDIGDADPVEHYLAIGAAEGRNPNPLFDTGYYARQMVRRMAGAERAG